MPQRPKMPKLLAVRLDAASLERLELLEARLELPRAAIIRGAIKRHAEAYGLHASTADRANDPATDASLDPQPHDPSPPA